MFVGLDSRVDVQLVNEMIHLLFERTLWWDSGMTVALFQLFIARSDLNWKMYSQRKVPQAMFQLHCKLLYVCCQVHCVWCCFPLQTAMS